MALLKYKGKLYKEVVPVRSRFVDSKKAPARIIKKRFIDAVDLNDIKLPNKVIKDYITASNPNSVADTIADYIVDIIKDRLKDFASRATKWDYVDIERIATETIEDFERMGINLYPTSIAGPKGDNIVREYAKKNNIDVY